MDDRSIAHTVYRVECARVLQHDVDEKYVKDVRPIDGEWEEFDDLHAAERHLDEIQKKWGDGSWEVFDGGADLDAIEYTAAKLERVERDEYDDEIDCDTLETRLSIPPFVQKAITRTQDTYWEYLDGLRDSFTSLEDSIEHERDKAFGRIEGDER